MNLMSKILSITLLSFIHLSAMEEPHKKNNDQEELNIELFKAASNGRLEDAKQLINKGAQVNYLYDGNDLTPLMVASSNDHLEMVQYLLRAGADVNLNANDTTALQYSAGISDPDIITILLKNDANPYALNKEGNGAIYNAALGSKIANLKILLNNITQLSQAESDSLKNWLCLTKKLENEQNIHLPKELRKLIAQSIEKSLAQELKNRVIQAGAIKTLNDLKKTTWFPNQSKESSELLNQYLDLDFLLQRVREQIKIPQLMESSRGFLSCVIQ